MCVLAIYITITTAAPIESHRNPLSYSAIACSNFTRAEQELTWFNFLWISGFFTNCAQKRKKERWRVELQCSQTAGALQWITRARFQSLNDQKRQYENLWPSPPDCRNQDGKSHFILERSDFCWCQFDTALSPILGEWIFVEIKSRAFSLGTNRGK